MRIRAVSMQHTNPQHRSSQQTTPVRLGRRAALGLGAGALAGLAGCARGSDSLPAPPGVVTYIGDVGTWGPGYAAASDVLDREIGLRISARSIAVPSNYQQFVRMSSLTNSTTDLIKWWNGYRLADLARGDVLTDLTDVWDAALENDWVLPAQRESFSYRGRQYAIPLTKSYYPVFYDKRLFADLGLTPPDTWDDFIAVATALRDADIVPIQAAGAASWESLLWFEQIVGGLDPEYYQAVTTNQASYLDATARDAMEIWSQMYADGLFSSPDADVAKVPAMMQEKTFGMLLLGSWFGATLVAGGFADDEIGLFLVPPVRAGGDQPVFVESGAMAVPANAHKHAEALKVAGNWLSTPVQQAWVNFLGETSPNPQAVPKVRFVQEFVDALATREPVELIRYWEASPPALVEGNVQDLGAFMVTPTAANATATLRSMQRRADAEWKAWTAP
jgi:multiple sugar transport system substrate-binding protein